MTIELPGPVAYVFTGGASNGAAQAGMLRAVEEANLQPDLVTGTSVGALNGAVVAEQPEAAGARLAEIWAGLETRHVFVDGHDHAPAQPRRDAPLHVLGTGTTAPGCQARHCGSHRGASAAAWCCRDRSDQRPSRAGAPWGSCRGGGCERCDPGRPPECDIGDTLMMDGGVVANAPVHAALEMGARSIVLFDAGYACHLMEPPRHAASRILHAMSVMLRRQMERDVPTWQRACRCWRCRRCVQCALRRSTSRTRPALIEEGFETSRRFLRDVVVDGPGVIGELHRHDGPVSPY